MDLIHILIMTGESIDIAGFNMHVQFIEDGSLKLLDDIVQTNNAGEFKGGFQPFGRKNNSPRYPQANSRRYPGHVFFGQTTGIRL